MSRFRARHKRFRNTPHAGGLKRWLGFLKLAALSLLLIWFMQLQQIPANANVQTSLQTAFQTGELTNKVSSHASNFFCELIIERPIERSRVEPVYPAEAKKAGISGVVVVKVLVDLEGNVEKTEILRSIAGLDEAALEAAKQFTFSPGKQQGRGVKTWVSIVFPFRL